MKERSAESAGDDGTVPDERYLALRVMMMPRDTNPYGTIFGGVVLSYIDQAGAIGARHAIAAQGCLVPDIVTVAMERVEFHHPVFVGDAVSFWTSVRKIGRTSVTMNVFVEAEREESPRLLTQAVVSYVAVELTGQSLRPVRIRKER